ncbi:MAG: XrtN system VIT domain-containing protein [Bacteroidetes bacterium]|nr:MAG: XrtN system VIT domain-containing protein [Bacteroidota bacterium]
MPKLPTLNTRWLHHLGLGLIVLSGSLFLITCLAPESPSGFLDLSGLFWINYALSVGYFVAILAHHWAQPRPRKGDEIAFARALVLFSLSAHTLNYGTEIKVFEPYVDWMIGYVLLMHVTLLLLPHRQAFPAWLRTGLYFLAGAGLVLAVYLTLFLGPLIMLALPLSLAFGVSMHATVPLWFAIEYGRLPWRMEKTNRARGAFWSGVLAPILILAGFLLPWHGLQRGTEAAQVRATAEAPVQGLPDWVVMSQYLPEGPLTEAVLMSDLFAQPSYWNWDDGLSRLGRRLAIRQRHDPLATAAKALYGPLELEEDLMVPLLDFRYAARHLTHRRLWRDTDVTVSAIDTRVQAYPAYRLAYLEHELQLTNTHPQPDNQQEAVLTFHLPEGATVTTLSLWVEGEERPARLTTRSKADSAYSTIVGRERRDPALLHWQEGDRVTLTVFPCTPAEARRVKVGFSFPLREADDRLHLQNIWFEGPPSAGAPMTAQLTVEDGSPAPDLPLGWKAQAEGWRYQGEWHPTWRVSWPRVPLAEGAFSWRGDHYRLEAVPETSEAFHPAAIYVDLHAGWDALRWEQLWPHLQGYEVYALLPEPVRITAANYSARLAEAQDRTFTLLPFHQLQPGSLVICQSPEATPLLSDLDGSVYAHQLQDWLARQEGDLRVWELGTQPAPYLRSLRAFRALEIRQGRLPALVAQLETGQWPVASETAEAVHLPGTQARLRREASSAPSTQGAPDHLARLYHYQDLLRTIGPRYFERGAHEEAWLDQARDAYVISPVASLVVLECEADYERFDIEATPEDSLGPVTVPSEAGAAPEPHEWALLGLVLLFGLAYLRRQKRGFQLNRA